MYHDDLIAKTIPERYDGEGKKVFRPFDRKKGPHPTYPMGRYVSQPLTVKCTSIEDVRQFLVRCRGVSDREQFGKEDYWQPPELFEQTKKGDCDDFALWTWRQLLAMGYDARFVGGRCGRYGAGHAWVEFFEGENCYLVEPQLRVLGSRMPRLSTLSYHPRFSVSWDGEKLSYFEHRDPTSRLTFSEVAVVLPEYLSVWAKFWLRSPVRVPRFLWHNAKRSLRGFRWIGKARPS